VEVSHSEFAEVGYAVGHPREAAGEEIRVRHRAHFLSGKVPERLGWFVAVPRLQARGPGLVRAERVFDQAFQPVGEIGPVAVQGPEKLRQTDEFRIEPGAEFGPFGRQGQTPFLPARRAFRGELFPDFFHPT